MTWDAIRYKLATYLAGVKIVNLIDNPSFEVDAVGASSGTVALARSNEAARFGDYSLKCTFTGAGSERVTIKQRDGNRFPVTPQRLYTWSHDLKPGATAQGSVHSDIAWFDAGGAEISKSFTAVGFFATDPWLRTSHSAIAPENAVTAECRFEEQISLGAGEEVYIDGLMFHEGFALPYIDGSLPGCAWSSPAFPHTVTSWRPLSRVYQYPPAAIQDAPCAIIYSPAEREVVARRGGHWRQMAYNVKVLILAADQKQEDAAALADAYSRQLEIMFDGAVTLGGAASLIGKERFGEGAGFQYPANSGHVYAGFEVVIPVRDDETTTFVA